MGRDEEQKWFKNLKTDGIRLVWDLGRNGALFKKNKKTKTTSVNTDHNYRAYENTLLGCLRLQTGATRQTSENMSSDHNCVCEHYL